MNDSSQSLTVVIPMYRQFYLEELLSDLYKQSDNNFHLIIVSDGPVDDFTPQVKNLVRDLRATVVEYREIIGREDPSVSWVRAVSHAPGGWVWLLGDDDRVDSGCVEAFNKSIADIPSGIQVCRFPVGILAQDGTRGGKRIFVAKTIEPKQFLKNRLLGRDLSFASEYVFQKARLEEIGGFVHFPFAWCSDDATWLQLAYPHGIFQLAGNATKVFWRNSSENTSSKIRQYPLDFARAERSFVNWALNDSFLGASLSGIRWKFRFAWWFAGKALQKELGPREFWMQISAVAADLKLSKLAIGSVATVLIARFAIRQLVILMRGR